MGGPLVSGIPYGSTNVYNHTPHNPAQHSAVSRAFAFFKKLLALFQKLLDRR
jgi:hypothetical protein